MIVTVGDIIIDTREVTNFYDKGYYFYVEINDKPFIFVEEEAKVIRNTLQTYIMRQKMKVGQHLHRIELIGIIEWLPELTYTPQGRAECYLLLRTDVDVNGEMIPLWQTIFVTEELAEYCSSEIDIGFLVKIEGFMNARVYFDDTKTPHLETFVVAKSVEII